jgi:hypothetical protein
MIEKLDVYKHIHPSDIIYSIEVRGMEGFACSIEYIPADLIKVGDLIIYNKRYYKVTSVASSEDSTIHGLFLKKVEDPCA